jgi:hypothetical protein
MNNISCHQSKKMLCFIFLLTISSILVTIIGAITYMYEVSKLIL